MAEGNGTSNSRGLRGAFESFVHSEAGGCILLLTATAVALVWANSPWAPSYDHMLTTKVAVSWGASTFALSLKGWINDGLMAVFFFVVGLEIKRELVVGELSSPQKAALPIIAAAGGMVVPAAIYMAFNRGGAGSSGWGVPMATDIAFALGILAVFGRRVPLGLKVFLAALAIADDLGAVAVIAFCYSARLNWAALLAAALLLALLAVVGRAGVRWRSVYVALALGVWLAVLASGVHATVAGILFALLVPVRARSGTRPLGLSLEENLHPYVAFVILPLFALFNAGVALGAGFTSELSNPVAIGVFVGLVAGKQIGVLGASWLAIRWGIASMPDGVTWRPFYGAACLAGIGFTMSLFITELAFTDTGLLTSAKVAIFGASLASGIAGSLVFLTQTRRAVPAA